MTHIVTSGFCITHAITCTWLYIADGLSRVHEPFSKSVRAHPRQLLSFNPV